MSERPRTLVYRFGPSIYGGNRGGRIRLLAAPVWVRRSYRSARTDYRMNRANARSHAIATWVANEAEARHEATPTPAAEIPGQLTIGDDHA